MATVSAITKISDTIWEIPTSFKPGMRVPARLYATQTLLEGMDEGVIDQVTNVAMLPGIVKYAMCMPDGHWGYGFCIGGVAATDPESGGIISPGGIGFDINCGMRLVVTNLTADEVKPHLRQLVDQLFARVPAGVGCAGFLRVSRKEFRQVVEQGARWCIKQDLGWKDDLARTEENGCIEGADAEAISDRAIERGHDQIGTLGSGNHYLEIQVAKPEHVFDQEAARAFGITIPNQVVVMFHCGSRGFGHQVATDYLQLFLRAMPKYGITVPDRELACAPFRSPEGQQYYAAMKCAINMSFANRQVILHRIREVFSAVFGRDPRDLGMDMVYDVAHNTAKLEQHVVDGTERQLLVHRKGSTRAFAPGMEGIPADYKDVGQPVIIGGSMETGSYLLAGVASGAQTFYSTAHGSGRTMSRARAKKLFDGRKLQHEMEQMGIYVRSVSYSGLAEEAGGAYKDIDEVVAATEQAGISKRVARFVPIGNVKG
jgi:tRNA-splicing ligase RtcB